MNFQEEKDKLSKTREQIIEGLNGALASLKETREKCKIHVLWDLDSTGEDIDSMIDKLGETIESIPFAEPGPEHKS